VLERIRRNAAEVATTIVSRIEVLEGRFASVIKAADGSQLLRAQEWLEQAQRKLDDFPSVRFGEPAAAQFDVLRQNRQLRKIGRGDLLIASIVLAHRATLVTRNLRHFRLVPGLQIENWAD
jgi:tRNA(fMet)-specific endonuclease VapC